MVIRVDDIEYGIINQYCWEAQLSPSDVIRTMIRSLECVEDETIVTDDLIIKIASKTRHSPLFVETTLRRYRNNWKLQAQALFKVDRSRLETATCLEDILDDKEPDYTELAVTLSTSTGYAPMQIERVLKRYPHNIEAQFLELFRALNPRIEEPGRVTLQIGDHRIAYNLNSLDELAAEVQLALSQTLPTEYDVARLTKMIDDADQSKMPSDQDFESWMKAMEPKE